MKLDCLQPGAARGICFRSEMNWRTRIKHLIIKHLPCLSIGHLFNIFIVIFFSIFIVTTIHLVIFTVVKVWQDWRIVWVVMVHPNWPRVFFFWILVGSSLPPNCNTHVKWEIYICTFVDIFVDVRLRGIYYHYQSWISQHQLLVSDLGNLKLQVQELTTFLRLSPCFLTSTSMCALTSMPSFLQPLTRLLICLTEFMMSSQQPHHHNWNMAYLCWISCACFCHDYLGWVSEASFFFLPHTMLIHIL